MSTPRQSQLEASIAGYRARLLRLDEAALASLAAAYEPGQAAILETIEGLVREIERAGSDITPSQAARLSRATELLRLIEAETARLAQAAGQTIPQAQTAAVNQAVERAEALTVAQAPDAQAAANIAREWTALNRGAMESLVGQLADGSPVNDWLQQVVGETVDAARAALMDGITRGLSPRQVGASLARISDMPLWRAQGAARDAMMTSYTSASMQTFAENEDILAGWTWHAAKQERTCLGCLAKDDGTVHPVTEQFFPRHNRCRCSPLPKLADDEGYGDDIETGVEWFNKQPQAVRDRMVPVGLRDEFRAGKVRIEDMATLQRDDRFGDRWRQSTITEARANAARRQGGGAAPEPTAPTAQVPQPTLSDAAQKTVRKEEDRIREKSSEIGVVVDPETGEKLFQSVGGHDSVTFTDDQIRQMKDKVLTHNHPGGWGYEFGDPRRAGNGFSTPDWIMASEADLLELRAVTPAYRYVARRPAGGWPPSDQLRTAYEELDEAVTQENMQRIRAGEITTSEASATHWDTVSVRVADRFGIPLERIDDPHEYYAY